MHIVDNSDTGGKLISHLGPGASRVLLIFFHGVGDLVMFLPVLDSLRAQFPHIHFDLGLNKELGQQALCPEAISLPGDWRPAVSTLPYDLVFEVRFPMEDEGRPTATKADLCCERELGIQPVNSNRLHLQPPPLIAVHFHSTSLPNSLNVPEDVARRIWDDILFTGCVPVETHFEHLYHNPANGRYAFVNQHVRDWPARLESLMALLGASKAFVGCVSGNFHLALSLLGPARVLLLERNIKASQVTKLPVAAVNLCNYRGGVYEWLRSLRSLRSASDA